jgi:hypothetical protein
MLSKVQVVLFRLSDPRKVTLLLSLLLFALTLAGCDGVPACPPDDSGGGCTSG